MKKKKEKALTGLMGNNKNWNLEKEYLNKKE
jgi:hypothetical protein